MTTPLNPLVQPARFSQLLKNSGVLVKNLAHNLSQNHTALKTNVLVLSSLILVMSRIAISQASSQQAKGTPQEHFRYREAIRTFIREAAGWTLSFLLLRSIENVIKMGMRTLFEINLNPTREALSKPIDKFIKTHELTPQGIIATAKGLYSQVKAYATQQALPTVSQETRPFYGSQFFLFNENNVFYKAFEGFIDLFSSSRSLSPTDKMKNFYEWFPILVGSIPAVTLSGYALERFNLDYSQPIIDSLAARHKKPTPTQPMSAIGFDGAQPKGHTQPLTSFGTPGQGTAKLSSGSLMAGNRFNNYMNHVQQRQLERQVFFS